MSSFNYALAHYQNSRMLFRDALRYEEESRFRNCLTIGCSNSFKPVHRDDWYCSACRAKHAELRRRYSLEGVLLDANARVKP